MSKQRKESSARHPTLNFGGNANFEEAHRGMEFELKTHSVVRFPFKRSRMIYAKDVHWVNEKEKREASWHTDWWPTCCGRFAFVPVWMVVWLAPFFLAGSCFILQNFQLRIGTYYYVHRMRDYDLMVFDKKGHMNTSDPVFGTFTMGTSPDKPSFGSLNDPIAGTILGKYQAVDILFLDMLAAVFPFSFTVACLVFDQPRVWARIMICFSVLALTKGFFAWITIEPDSNGWKACKERLAGSMYNVDWYSQERSLPELLMMPPGSRLCADMMYSGHTYFVTIFALGLFESVRRATRSWGVWSCRRITAEICIAVFAITQQSIEIYFVLKSHFHYTADVFMALLITYLVYTNTSIAVLATLWTKPHLQNVCLVGKSKFFLNGLTRSSMINLGCCCCPFSQHYIYSHNDMMSIISDIEEANGTDVDGTPIKIVPEKCGDFLKARLSLLDEKGGGDSAQEGLE